MTSPKRRRSAREARRRRAAAEQLARRIGIPLRCVGAFTSSKLPDAQAMQGSVTSLYTALLCGANFVLHAAGWLEAALTIGYEKLVLDADHLGAVHTPPGGLPLDANALAMDAFREVDPGGHFFGLLPHPLQLRDRVPRMRDRGYGLLRELVRRRKQGFDDARQREMEGDPARLPGPDARSRHRRGAQGVHGQKEGVHARYLAFGRAPGPLRSPVCSSASRPSSNRPAFPPW